jgi:hypothetical protein
MPLPPDRSPSIHRITRKEIAARAALAANAEHHAGLPPNLSFDILAAVANTGLTEYFVRTAIRDRRLPAKLAGQKLLILRADLARFLESLPLYIHPAHRKGQ